MAVNKVLFGGETVIDLTSDTVTAASMMQGVTAHGKDGNPVVGTFTLESELTQQDDLIAQIIAALEQKQPPKQ